MAAVASCTSPLSGVPLQPAAFAAIAPGVCAVAWAKESVSAASTVAEEDRNNESP
jgi:hypothetical protein